MPQAKKVIQQRLQQGRVDADGLKESIAEKASVRRSGTFSSLSAVEQELELLEIEGGGGIGGEWRRRERSSRGLLQRCSQWQWRGGGYKRQRERKRGEREWKQPTRRREQQQQWRRRSSGSSRWRWRWRWRDRDRRRRRRHWRDEEEGTFEGPTRGEGGARRQGPTDTARGRKITSFYAPAVCPRAGPSAAVRAVEGDALLLVVHSGKEQQHASTQHASRAQAARKPHASRTQAASKQQQEHTHSPFSLLSLP